jgi:hypothetical protein
MVTVKPCSSRDLHLEIDPDFAPTVCMLIWDDPLQVGHQCPVEVQLRPERPALKQVLVQNQRRGQASRSQKKGGTGKPAASGADPNRHSILGTS